MQTNKLRKDIYKALDEWFESLPEKKKDETVLHAGKSYTARDLMQEINLTTEFGNGYVECLVELDAHMKEKDSNFSIIDLIKKSIRK